jgi:hypothetical protein
MCWPENCNIRLLRFAPNLSAMSPECGPMSTSIRIVKLDRTGPIPDDIMDVAMNGITLGD